MIIKKFYKSVAYLEAVSIIKSILRKDSPFIVLTGHEDSGKSALVQTLGSELENFKTVVLDNFYEDTDKCCLDILSKLNVNAEMERKNILIQKIIDQTIKLNSKGISLLIVIDDAHEMKRDVFEDILELLDTKVNGKNINIIFLLVTNNHSIKIIKEWESEFVQPITTNTVELSSFSLFESTTFIKAYAQKYGFDLNNFKDDDFRAIYEYTNGLPGRICKIIDLMDSNNLKDSELTIKHFHSLAKSLGLNKKDSLSITQLNKFWYIIFALLIITVTAVLLKYKFYPKNNVTPVSKSLPDNNSVADKYNLSNVDNAKDNLSKSALLSEKNSPKKNNVKDNSSSNKIDNTAKVPSICIVLKKNLKLRSSPSIEAEYIMVINSGKKIKIIKETDEWIEVRYKGKNGWLFNSNEYIKKSECN